MVALFAVLVVSGVILWSSRSDLRTLILRQHDADLHLIAIAAAQAYTGANTWAGADLGPAAAMAARVRATLVVHDPAGRPVAAPTEELANLMMQMHGTESIDLPRGHEHTAPVMVGGRQVGTVILRFPVGSDIGPESHLRKAMTRTVITSTIVAVLAAVVMAVFVARRFTDTVTSVTNAARRLAAGDLSARPSLEGAPGELGALAQAFDDMAVKLEREDLLRRRLTADVAHELRTPIAVLQAQTEALVDGVSELTPEAMVSLHEETLRLGRLVQDMEALAAAEAAMLNLHLEPLDLRMLANRAATLASAAAEAQGHPIVVDLQPAPAWGDEDRIMQVLTNLLANAVRYAEEDGSVEVRTYLAGDCSIVEVTNAAVPIPETELTHLFDRFWRGIASRGTPGSGIGLAIVRELAAAHNGSVKAENGDGTVTFRLTLPASSDALTQQG